MSVRINIGCGQTPTDGWNNYDNSPSIRLATIPLLPRLMRILKLLNQSQERYISFAKNAQIRWANASKHIPEKDGSVEVVYSSHMLEHLDGEDAVKFLKEARRVLKSGGIIRIAVPDIKYCVESYLKDGDADAFVALTGLGRTSSRSILERIRHLAVGDRSHKWMYDGRSLCKLLESVGYQEARAMEQGTTTIPASAPLDLAERPGESLYVEAVNP